MTDCYMTVPAPISADKLPASAGGPPTNVGGVYAGDAGRGGRGFPPRQG
jgi:hypothetical protein